MQQPFDWSVFSGNSDASMRSLWRGKEVKRSNRFNLVMFLKQAFLPEGFPASVTDDYLDYQMYDTMQAFCSSLVGHLATQGILKASGVGDAQASAISATLIWMLSDGLGHSTSILFAWRNSTSLDAYCKQFRLFADVANDVALFLGLVSGLSLFSPYFALLLCLQSVLRSIVGVAGSATRAAVVSHQARAGNVSDVSAKDGSQETVVGLVALATGMFLVPAALSRGWQWYLYVILTCGHLWANHKAVRSLRLLTLNPIRLDLAIERNASHKTLVPSVVNAEEPIWPNELWRHRRLYPPLHMGMDCAMLKEKEQRREVERKGTKKYVIVGGGNTALFEEGVDASSVDVLQAYYEMRTKTTDGFESFVENLKKEGWNLNRLSLCVDEYRFRMEEEGKKEK